MLRPIDARIPQGVDRIKPDPLAALSAQDCARSVNLSFPRFVQRFNQEEVGVSLRDLGDRRSCAAQCRRQRAQR